MAVQNLWHENVSNRIDHRCGLKSSSANSRFRRERGNSTPDELGEDGNFRQRALQGSTNEKNRLYGIRRANTVIGFDGAFVSKERQKPYHHPLVRRSWLGG